MKHIPIIIAALVLVGCDNTEVDTTLIQAAKKGNTELVKSALNNGANVNAKDADGWTALHQAALYGPKEAVELLIAKGAAVNVKEKDGWTPLDQAAYNGIIEVAEFLISKGADVNAKNNMEMSPLHHASIKGHKQIVQLLISQGADVNAKVALGPKQGLTSLDAANETNHHEIAELLRKQGGKTGEELEAEEI